MYSKYYGLRESPFNVTSDPNFLFLSKAHKEALAYLLYGIRQKKGFIEITGEIGAGKTTLCRALIRHLDKNAKTALILNSSLSGPQLLEAIVEDLGLLPARKSKISLFRQLNNFLLQEVKRNSSVVLILDEAQNLKTASLEEIRLLSNLETEKQKLFQIILVGQPQLKEKLNSPSLVQLRQRIAVRFHIGPLEKKEISNYIYHRLKVAGSKGDIIFKKEALDKISEYSGGIPRLINLVCDRALLMGFVIGTKIIDYGMIEKSIFEIEGKLVEVSA
jgi:general secretion pathway protein A